MNARKFLGPFSGLTTYNDEVDVDATFECKEPEEVKSTFLLIDFDVRPALAYATSKTLLDRYTKQPLWYVCVDKVCSKLKSEFTLDYKPPVKVAVNGICDDGTMSCTLILKAPTGEGLRRSMARLNFYYVTQKKKWGMNVVAPPYRVDAKTMANGPFEVQHHPKQDRIQFQVMDSENKRKLYMVAESFYATTDAGRSFPFSKWDMLRRAMLRGERA